MGFFEDIVRTIRRSFGIVEDFAEVLLWFLLFSTLVEAALCVLTILLMNKYFSGTSGNKVPFALKIDCECGSAAAEVRQKQGSSRGLIGHSKELDRKLDSSSNIKFKTVGFKSTHRFPVASPEWSQSISETLSRFGFDSVKLNAGPQTIMLQVSEVNKNRYKTIWRGYLDGVLQWSSH